VPWSSEAMITAHEEPVRPRFTAGAVPGLSHPASGSIPAAGTKLWKVRSAWRRHRSRKPGGARASGFDSCTFRSLEDDLAVARAPFAKRMDPDRLRFDSAGFHAVDHVFARSIAAGPHAPAGSAGTSLVSWPLNRPSRPPHSSVHFFSSRASPPDLHAPALVRPGRLSRSQPRLRTLHRSEPTRTAGSPRHQPVKLALPKAIAPAALERAPFRFRAPRRRSPTRKHLVRLQIGPLHGPNADGRHFPVKETSSWLRHSGA